MESSPDAVQVDRVSSYSVDDLKKAMPRVKNGENTAWRVASGFFHEWTRFWARDKHRGSTGTNRFFECSRLTFVILQPENTTLGFEEPLFYGLQGTIVLLKDVDPIPPGGNSFVYQSSFGGLHVLYGVVPMVVLVMALQYLPVEVTWLQLG